MGVRPLALIPALLLVPAPVTGAGERAAAASPCMAPV